MTRIVGKISLSQLEHPQFGGLCVVDAQQSDIKLGFHYNYSELIHSVPIPKMQVIGQVSSRLLRNTSRL